MRKLPLFLMASAMIFLFSCGGAGDNTSAEGEESIEELMDEVDSIGGAVAAENLPAEQPAADTAAAQ